MKNKTKAQFKCEYNQLKIALKMYLNSFKFLFDVHFNHPET